MLGTLRNSQTEVLINQEIDKYQLYKAMICQKKTCSVNKTFEVENKILSHRKNAKGFGADETREGKNIITQGSKQALQSNIKRYLKCDLMPNSKELETRLSPIK